MIQRGSSGGKVSSQKAKDEGGQAKPENAHHLMAEHVWR